MRVGEEDPRCSVHSDRKIAVAINLNKRDRESIEGAVEACTKEWDKLRKK